mgnify:CR=1 FL=1
MIHSPAARRAFKVLIKRVEYLASLTCMFNMPKENLIAFSNYLRKSVEYNLNRLTFTFEAQLYELLI